MIQPDPIRRAGTVQHEAACPDTSVALRASAGSGKTRVLIDRFIRLCIEGEHNDTHPRSILAITFTRKAATEIRERLLDRARDLALCSEADREAKLTALVAGRVGGPLRPVEVDRAARLYEKLLEDTGGLQVGTIHSFCQRILTRFATEAGLDPHARLVEDREDLLEETLDRLEVMMAADSALGSLGGDIGPTPGSVRKAMEDVFKQQMRLDRWIRRAAARADVPAKPRRDLVPALLAEVRAFLFPAQELPEDLAVATLLPDLDRLVAAFADTLDLVIIPGLEPETKERVAKYLGELRDNAVAARALKGSEEQVAAVRSMLLTTTGSVRKFSRAGTADMKAELQAAVVEHIGPLLEMLRRLELVTFYRRNRAQLILGLRALDILDTFKQRDRVLDFGDLEDMACTLMGDQARALSLLFRLEDSIRHVLVDEFQDTNFNQQDILAPFINEFLGGGGADAAVASTVFLVGDMKQSIYGFRGAEPEIFAGALAGFRDRQLPTPTLPTNFRSLPAVVDGVGQVFGAEPLAHHLPEGEGAHVHQAYARKEGDGVLILAEAYQESDDGRTADQVAADAAARLARDLVDGGQKTWEGFAPPVERDLQWRDILVLYRSRTGVSLYEQAFRAAGIPIEPAGRGMLAAGREVQDILALLHWLVWTDDDVALATVLRSPLFRLSEKVFQELLAARELFREGPDGPDGRPLPPRNLWWALRKHREGEGPLAEAAQRLEAWRGDTGLVGCHELLRRIFREGDVLARYGAAGGPQARLNLERLYDLALGPEVAATPTVRHFIDLVDKAGRRGGQDEGTAPESEGAGRVRFMTIHGAKGLEAPVVLLIDADRAITDKGSEVRLNPDDDASGLVFGATKAVRRGIEGADEILDGDLLQRAAEEAAATAGIEENNLLYVALTRARDRLYVLGGKSSAKDGDLKTQLARVRAAAAGSEGPAECDDPDDWVRPPEPVRAPADQEGDAPENHLWQPPVLGERLKVVLPSSAGSDAMDLKGGGPVPGGLSPREFGIRVHRLLEWAAESGSLPPGDSPLHDEVRGVIEDPDLAWIFQPETGLQGHCEVPFIHRTKPGGPGKVEERVTGVIDRLIVGPDRIEVIDYKTNRLGSDPAHRAALIEHYRPQMEAYRAAAEALFPGREVRAHLLWTDPALAGEKRWDDVE